MPYAYQTDANGHYVCPLCGATKERQNTMHYHLKSHERARHPPVAPTTHRCPHCTKEFLQSQNLALHIAARHPASTSRAPPAFQCPSCPYNSHSRSTCVRHYLWRHIPKSARDAATALTSASSPSRACTTCGKVSASPNAHFYHIASAGCLRLCPEQQELLNTLLKPRATE